VEADGRRLDVVPLDELLIDANCFAWNANGQFCFLMLYSKTPPTLDDARSRVPFEWNDSEVMLFVGTFKCVNLPLAVSQFCSSDHKRLHGKQIATRMSMFKSPSVSCSTG
jgi:hypothetical protein